MLQLPAAPPPPHIGFGHTPSMACPDGNPAFSTAQAEQLLSDWFEAPVVMASSGRAGFTLFLEQFGCHLYRTRLSVPRFLSHCVIGSLARNGFPIQEAGGDVVLHYHQYGFRQATQPREKLVLEDIAHAFFGSSSSGARAWRGGAAAFSLPKFFGTAGLLGGLVVPDPVLADQLRDRRDARQQPAPDVLEWRRNVVMRCHADGTDPTNHALIEGAYALYPVFPQPDPVSLASMPQALDDIRHVAAARLQRVALLHDCLGPTDAGMLAHAQGGMPFAFPHFGQPEILAQADAALAEMGLNAGIYSLDIARDMYAPDYQRALMIPCHHQVPLPLLEEACRAILALTSPCSKRQKDVAQHAEP